MSTQNEMTVDQQIRLQAIVQANQFPKERTAEELIEDADRIAAWLIDGSKPSE